MVARAVNGACCLALCLAPCPVQQCVCMTSPPAVVARSHPNVCHTRQWYDDTPSSVCAQPHSPASNPQASAPPSHSSFKHSHASSFTHMLHTNKRQFKQSGGRFPCVRRYTYCTYRYNDHCFYCLTSSWARSLARHFMASLPSSSFSRLSNQRAGSHADPCSAPASDPVMQAMVSVSPP